MVSQHFLTERRLTGALLLLGTLLFFIGVSLAATLPDEKGNFVVLLPLQEQLPVIAAHVGRWQWGFGGVLAGGVVTGFGLAMLSSLLRDAGDRVLSRLGLIGFLFGAVFWATNVTFRMSVMVWVAQATAAGAAMPDFWPPLNAWSTTFVIVYLNLAYLSLAAYGGALLLTRLLPRWIGWATIVWSSAWLVGDLVAQLRIPAVLHIMPFVIGVLLMLPRHQSPVAGRSEQDRVTWVR